MARVYNIITLLSIQDPEGFARYVAGHPPTLVPFGGRFVAKGQETLVEGDSGGHRVIIQEFPSEQAFYRWYHSPAYRPWKTLRQASAKIRAALVTGC